MEDKMGNNEFLTLADIDGNVLTAEEIEKRVAYNKAHKNDVPTTPFVLFGYYHDGDDIIKYNENTKVAYLLDQEQGLWEYSEGYSNMLNDNIEALPRVYNFYEGFGYKEAAETSRQL